MSTLKSALLNVLPVAERSAITSSGGAGDKLFQDNVSHPQRESGVAGLKALMKSRKANAFKYNAGEDRLYVYFSMVGYCKEAISYFKLYPAVISNLPLHVSSSAGFRIDNASKYNPVVKKAEPAVQTFEKFVEGVKNAFAAFKSTGVSLTYKVDKTANRVYAYAGSNRKNGPQFTIAKNKVASTHKFHIVSSGEYNVTLRFDFDQKQEVGYNTLLKGLEEVAAPAVPAEPVKPVIAVDPASKLEGLVPQETLEQVRRILAGERLPKPPVVPKFVTSGQTELKLFVSAGKELDLAKTIAELNQTGKDTAVFTYGQLGYAYFGTTTVHNPTVVVMRDYSNKKGAFVILRTAAGYHAHFQIKQV